VPDLEGTEALRGGVVRARDLPEAFGEDFADLKGKPRLQLRLLEPGLHEDERVVEATELTQVAARGEAEEARGGQDGPKCQALVLLVDHTAELAADRRAEGSGTVGSGSPRDWAS
jgi:hypothetical protein